MDYKEFLDKKFLDDVAKEKNEIKVTEIDDFIGVFDNAAPKSYCKLLIDYFDKMQDIGRTVARKSNDNTTSTKKDNSLYFFMSESDPLWLGEQTYLTVPFINAIEDAYKLYVEKYGTLETIGRHMLNHDIKLQKTLPGEGYHVWHCEAADMSSSKRVLLCMLYLNDVEEGGETEFLNQHKRINSVEGRVVLCPTAFTHAHRGNPPLKTAKYMINGWIEFTSYD